jgi:hypothetical protein
MNLGNSSLRAVSATSHSSAVSARLTVSKIQWLRVVIVSSEAFSQVESGTLRTGCEYAYILELGEEQ